MELLIFTLEGVLQSWGERSRWDWRDSADMPTKSAVIGMLGCAMGLPREDERLASLSAETVMAVRADRIGSVTTDYHTVTAGAGGLVTANRGKRSSPTLVSHRAYRQDACYTVFLRAPAPTLRRMEEALRHPVWPIYLGRRSCPPIRPVVPVVTNEYASLRDAAHRYPPQKPIRRELDAVMNVEIEDGLGMYVRRDQAICSARYQYAYRRLIRDTVDRKELIQCT